MNLEKKIRKGDGSVPFIRAILLNEQLLKFNNMNYFNHAILFRNVLKHFYLVCFLVLSITVSANDLDVIITPASGPFASDGAINLVVAGGVAPYEFAWANSSGIIFSDQEDIDNLFPGFYTVGVTDALCGMATLEVEVVYDCKFAIESLTPTCICDYGYGSINVEFTGGSGNYTYFWEGPGIPGSTAPNPVIPAPGGTYYGFVTDLETGCSLPLQATVSECKSFDISPFVEVTPDCNEEGTSTISVQLPPGMGLGPFEFRWIKVGVGVVEFDPSENGFASLENATEGQYCLKVQTMNGCEDQVCDIVVETRTAPVIHYSVTPSVNGDGSISLDVSGKPGPFSYLWETGQTSPAIGNLDPGIYCVTVTDINGNCTATECIDVLNCDKIQQLLNNLEVQITLMNGESLGAIDLLIPGILSGYQFNYSWTGPNGFTSDMEDIKGLNPGFYEVNITMDACSSVLFNNTWTICDFITEIKLSPATNCSMVLAEVSVNPSGDYDYAWNFGATSASVTLLYSNDDYCVTVTQSGTQCSGSLCFRAEPLPISIDLVNLQNDTWGLPANGSIEVSAGGGLAPWQFNWSNGVTGPLNQGLSSGTYTVTVTDACGNSGTASYNIQCELIESTISGTVTNVSCTSGEGGSVNLTTLPFPGTTPVYLYSWSNGNTSQDIYDLAAGEYCVTITEINTGCVGFACFEVGTTGEGQFSVSFEMDPGCYPLSEGQITANASNSAMGPFEYYWYNWNWSTNQTQYLGNTAMLTDVPAGWYSVILTDAMGCTASNYTLMWPSTPTFTVVAEPIPPVVCQGQVAALSLAVFGLDPPQQEFTFELVNYSEYPLTTIPGNSVSGLEPGSWGVTVTDAHGCQAFDRFIVEDGTPLFTATVEQGCQQGSIQLNPFSGYVSHPPFTYQWSDGSDLKDRYGLEEGIYFVTVTNALGCTAVQQFEIEYLNANMITGSNIQTAGGATEIAFSSCGNFCNGSIDLEIDPSFPATYSWSNGKTTQDINGLCAGTYSVTVTSGDCVETQAFIVAEANDISCELYYEASTPAQWDGGYRYDLPYFSLEAWEVNCYDPECGEWDYYCSKLHISPHVAVPNGNCWTGMITITYPKGGGSVVLTVAKNQQGIYQISIISGEDEWKVPEAGTYDVVVHYEGSGESEGDDCTTTVQANWYGDGNYNDAVGFNSGLWWDTKHWNIPEEFLDAYITSWSCQTCKPVNEYVFDDGICENFGNFQSTFFNFVPEGGNYAAENPCNLGGTLTYLDFNEFGMPVIQTVEVPPGNYPYLEGAPPFGNGDAVDCAASGWCLFEALEIGIYENAGLEKPLLATFGTDCKPFVFDDPTENPGPCATSADCPLGFDCDPITGNCVQPCDENNDCMFGECVGGECVETGEEEGCIPPCPEGYMCHQGECFLNNICGFSESVQGQGGINTYHFYHDVAPDAKVTYNIEYKTYNIPDEFFIYHGNVEIAHFPVPDPDPCVATGVDNWDNYKFNITGGGEITIVVKSCGSSSSKFQFVITCEFLFNSPPPYSLKSGTGSYSNGAVAVHPNPFESTIDILASNVENPFTGQVILLDNLGREIVNKEYTFETGTNRLNITGLDGLMKGLYIVLIKKDGRFIVSQKVVKVK